MHVCTVHPDMNVSLFVTPWELDGRLSARHTKFTWLSKTPTFLNTALLVASSDGSFLNDYP